MDYKYRLTWYGRRDTEMLRETFEHSKTFNLFRDSKARLITHTEYKELVELKEIAEPQSYWQIKEGQLGLISLDYYTNYKTTWDLVNSSMTDFQDGWRACEKSKS